MPHESSEHFTPPACEGGQPAAEWTWEGNDEMESASGRGSAVLETKNHLTGQIVFHRGDRSEFIARRWPRAKRKKAAK